jgi:AraC family transcriptional regulator
MTVTPAKTRPPEDSARKRYAARIDRVVDYIDANLEGDLSLETLARIANFSPFHFHRQFAAHTGIGVARLVRLLRLRRAALRLAFSPERSITEIALESGFNHTDSFGRAFKDVHGQSPSEFRARPQRTGTDVAEVRARLQETRMNKRVEIVDFPTTPVAAVEYRGAPEHACRTPYGLA